MKLIKMSAALALVITLGSGCDQMNPKGDTEKKDSGKSTSSGGTSSGGSTAQPAGPDMRDYMQVSSPMMGWPKDAAMLKDGLWVESKSSGAGYKTATKYAIVGTAGDMVKVEVSGDATQGYVQALTVNKADGKVTKAQAGKKGEALKDIKIAASPVAPAGEAPKGTDEDVTVKAGTFKGTKIVTKSAVGGGDITTWSGIDGDTKGVLLKSSDGKNDYELTSVKVEDMTIGGKSYKVKHVAYSNGMEMWTAPDVNVPFISFGHGTTVKMVAGGNTTENTWGEGAKAELDWK